METSKELDRALDTIARLGTKQPMDVNSPEAALWSENMRLKSENEQLRLPFKHADSLDWEYLDRLLLNAVRNQHDQQTKFWLFAMRATRAVLTNGQIEEKSK
jgi:hypothetical protein